MNKRLFAIAFLLWSLPLFSQKKETQKAATDTSMYKADARALKAESAIITHGEVTINGQPVAYTATAGTMPVWDEGNKVAASLFYTYYQRTGTGDQSKRPLIFSFNGGPGSASAWMHIAFTGPKLLKMDEEGFPTQPYGIKDNPYSLLDVADIVYIDPVNTGYSRVLDPNTQMRFFGVNEDIKYLAEWLNTFVTRNNRWLSPKYLIGESYGTTRVSGLALELENQQWMYLNGVVLVSPTDLGIERNGPVAAALRLPYFAATAWYHKMLPAELQQKDLTDMLPEVENFTINKLLPAITRGGFLEDSAKKEIATKMAAYSGLSQQFILQNNLEISPNSFWKELLRDKGYTIGRLDSRYLGIDRQDAGTNPDYNAELVSWLHSFTPAINYYLREELKYKTDVKYNMFGNVFPWNPANNHTGEDLRKAMAQNPYLHVLILSGYYDGACDYFNAKYSMWQLDPSGKMKDRLSWEGYRSGHMLYLRQEDLRSSTEHLRDFIRTSLPKTGQAAKYARQY